jgi:hypothetical protein
MTNFTSLPHSVSAALGALIVSTLFITAAVGPGASVQAAPVQTASVQISAQAHA